MDLLTLVLLVKKYVDDDNTSANSLYSKIMEF